jgi:hypothetical protein
MTSSVGLCEFSVTLGEKQQKLAGKYSMIRNGMQLDSHF